MDSESVSAERARAEGKAFTLALYVVLRGGALLAAALLAIGLVIYFLDGRSLALDSGAADPFVTHLALHDPIGWLGAGIVVLIVLPIARVVLSLFHFIAWRDRFYIVLTSAVLAVLAAGIVFGKAL